MAEGGLFLPHEYATLGKMWEKRPSVPSGKAQDKSHFTEGLGLEQDSHVFPSVRVFARAVLVLGRPGLAF